MMLSQFVWPPEEPKRFFLKESQVVIDEQIFGALSQDRRNPFSRISVANSSFSLDPYRGCPLGCAYCIVAGSLSDLSVSKIKSEMKYVLPTKPKRLFSGFELVENLIRHPAFIANKSIVSIGTASTEAFLDGVEDDTWQIMKHILDLGLRNPFWIVTKYGMPDHLVKIWSERIGQLSKNGIPVVLSITYSGAPDWVEPYKGNRFRNLLILKNEGVKLSHHLRPIIMGINDDEESMKRALSASLDVVENVCVGGLRKDTGVELAWEYFHHNDLNLLPDTDREKVLPDDYLKKVGEFIRKGGYKTPVFRRSSEAISSLLGIPDYNLYRYRPSGSSSFLHIRSEIAIRLEKSFSRKLTEILKSLADSIKLTDIEFNMVADNILVNRKMSYQEHRALIHAIGHSEILP